MDSTTYHTIQTAHKYRTLLALTPGAWTQIDEDDFKNLKSRSRGLVNEIITAWIVRYSLIVSPPVGAVAAPDFLPEGEFDYYRSQWERIAPTDGELEEIAEAGLPFGQLKITRYSSTAGTNWTSVTADQAERILKILSEENR